MSKQNPTVMVVEDEDLLLQAITKKLSLNGITVIGCISGDQALFYLENHPQLPDAIWLDYYLKDMNGLEFMSKLKEKFQWAQLPVFVVSNSANQDKVNRMLSLGAKQYILKAEHRLDDIIATVKQFILENE
jgi:DNA-binding response OmpR family regulator